MKLKQEYKDGASLFYTTQSPATLQSLRQYALHLLFSPPAPAPSANSSAEVAVPHRNPFPFNEKANILDRDRIIIPSGWDSWGKIAVLRDGFDSKLWGEAWDRDLEAGEDDAQDVKGIEPGAKALYGELVPDRGIKVRCLLNFTSQFVFISLSAASSSTFQRTDARAGIPRKEL